MMHELAVCRGIIEIAEAALTAPAPRVVSVSVRVGRLTGIAADSLRHYFDLLSPSTRLAGATLLLEEVPIRARCSDCKASFEIDALAFTCPACASGFLNLLSGRELQVVSLETAEEVTCGS